MATCLVVPRSLHIRHSHLEVKHGSRGCSENRVPQDVEVGYCGTELSVRALRREYAACPLPRLVITESHAPLAVKIGVQIKAATSIPLCSIPADNSDN